MLRLPEEAARAYECFVAVVLTQFAEQVRQAQRRVREPRGAGLGIAGWGQGI